MLIREHAITLSDNRQITIIYSESVNPSGFELDEHPNAMQIILQDLEEDLEYLYSRVGSRDPSLGINKISGEIADYDDDLQEDDIAKELIGKSLDFLPQKRDTDTMTASLLEAAINKTELIEGGGNFGNDYF